MKARRVGGRQSLEVLVGKEKIVSIAEGATTAPLQSGVVMIPSLIIMIIMSLDSPIASWSQRASGR